MRRGPATIANFAPRRLAFHVVPMPFGSSHAQGGSVDRRLMDTLKILCCQARPHRIGAPFAAFAAEARAARAAHPQAQMLVWPELHLFHPGLATIDADNAALRASAQPLGGPLDRALAALAAELGVMLVPGTLVEAGEGGRVFNTMRVYAGDGSVMATYRKVFVWRPSEPYDPGAEWVVLDVPGFGRLGLTICYDAWFPESMRQVAWLGADAVLNLVKTTTGDRPQEKVLARANALVNQVWMVSVNLAGPEGAGGTIVVDPQGDVVAEAGEAPTQILVTIDRAAVEHTRRDGTCGVNRMWSQFRHDDAPIALPAYGGRIDPAAWDPARLKA